MPAQVKCEKCGHINVYIRRVTIPEHTIEKYRNVPLRVGPRNRKRFKMIQENRKLHKGRYGVKALTPDQKVVYERELKRLLERHKESLDSLAGTPRGKMKRLAIIAAAIKMAKHPVGREEFLFLMRSGRSKKGWAKRVRRELQRRELEGLKPSSVIAERQASRPRRPDIDRLAGI